MKERERRHWLHVEGGEGRKRKWTPHFESPQKKNDQARFWECAPAASADLKSKFKFAQIPNFHLTHELTKKKKKKIFFFFSFLFILILFRVRLD